VGGNFIRKSVHLPELREIAEPMLREALEEDTELRWMQGNN